MQKCFEFFGFVVALASIIITFIFVIALFFVDSLLLFEPNKMILLLEFILLLGGLIIAIFMFKSRFLS